MFLNTYFGIFWCYDMKKYQLLEVIADGATKLVSQCDTPEEMLKRVLCYNCIQNQFMFITVQTQHGEVEYLVGDFVFEVDEDLL